MNLTSRQQGSMPPHQQTVEEVLASLTTDVRRGLSEAEARLRLEGHGPNELTAEQPVPAWRKFLAQFADMLVILLLIATAISASGVSGSSQVSIEEMGSETSVAR